MEKHMHMKKGIRTIWLQIMVVLNVIKIPLLTTTKSGLAMPVLQKYSKYCITKPHYFIQLL